jgi:hypothetical protein
LIQLEINHAGTIGPEWLSLSTGSGRAARPA